ncbi:MAG TPA: ABC transporter permease [Terriglobia bacterium]|nr:ABC transporter permease [Terriglobia bacterium]
MRKDLAYAWRTLRKSPVFALTAATTLALGIGASTAIFSVTDAVLLRPLPYPDANRLVLACSDMTRRHVRDFPFSNADFIDLKNGSKRFFEDFAALNTGRGVVPREDGTSEQVVFAGVTTNFFHLLGARILVGRDFTDSDGTPQPPPPPGATPNAAGQNPAAGPAAPQLPTFAILSYSYWQRRYGGDASIVGHGLLRAGNISLQIVGVLAPGFELFFPPNLNIEQSPDIWVANRLAYDAANRLNVSLQPVGKLKTGVSLRQAQSEVDVVAAENRQAVPILQTAGYAIRLEPMKGYLVTDVRPAILALMGAVIFLLLIACSNVANLLLVRASLRERELAVRTALGGSRWRLVRQMLAEALLLSAFGTALGVALAWAGIRELLAIAPQNLPRLESITINPAVVVFAALAGLLSTVLFGIAPALRASRPDVMNVLRSSARVGGLSGGGLLRSAVVVAEVALCFVLLIGSGLMIRSFLALQRIDPGYDPKGLLTFNVLGGFQGRPQPDQRAALMRELRDKFRSLPGVESIGSATPFPLAGGFAPIRWGLEPALADPSKFQAADLEIVLPGYFETLRTPLLWGRTFTDADNAPNRKVVMVDQALAAKAFPNESAVGKRILVRINTPQPEWVEIVGVVGHQRDTSLAESGREQVYVTDGFIGHGAAQTWALRTSGNPANLAGPVRAAVAQLDPRLLITEMQPMQDLVEKSKAPTRFSLLLIGVFAVIAALLAAIGLYGVLSTVVRQRTAEIGVRMAMGAVPGNIFKLVVGQGLRLSAAGVVIGLLAALAFTRVMTSMLVNIRATDPATYVLMATLFFVIAALASWLPARRAAALHPSVALREE